jgi:hypothetical protein
MLRYPWELLQGLAHYQNNRDNALIATYQSLAMLSENYGGKGAGQQSRLRNGS